MKKIHKKTLEDLELDKVVLQISGNCGTQMGKERSRELSPIRDRIRIMQELNLANDYLSSFDNDNRIPSHYFEDINKELQLLKIENSVLETESFNKIASIYRSVSTLLQFLKKFKEYYGHLFNLSTSLKLEPTILTSIEAIVDKYGEVKNSASPSLATIRTQINEVRSKIGQSFNQALSSHAGLDHLDEIRETVIDNKRVLAVKAMHRRKVKGSILGNSKTGSIVYIEPEATLKYARELNNLEYDETEEIKKILKQLTSVIRPYSDMLTDYQEFLVKMDVISAKAKYAKSINAILPNVNEERRLFLRDAYHPLLYTSNKKQDKITYPQTIELTDDNRIIVISGPNAGGKSITLKTVGLLQLMLQSGILVPVHERSSFCLFANVLSDIGDHQSIENHLSTYSYRLKQMNYFLRKCDRESLFLIDEFGTGSDPELGGALAETFLEVFYEREAFGIITTHYSNLKVLANELPAMENANMEFNQKTFQPTFKLGLGQPGSSFTFEVAQKNGIPYSLINKSKKKIEKGKVRFDATIAKLQKDRSNLQRTEKSLRIKDQKKQTETERLADTNEKIQKKLESYQELYDRNQKLISLGEKLDSLSEKYFNDKRKRDLMSELFRIVQIENSKRKRVSKSEEQQRKSEEQKIKKELNKEITKIRKKKKVEKKQEKEKPKPVLKVGDRVRLLDSKAVGSIDTLEKNKAIVNYGIFKTNVDVEKLELVESAKHK